MNEKLKVKAKIRRSKKAAIVNMTFLDLNKRQYKDRIKASNDPLEIYEANGAIKHIEEMQKMYDAYCPHPLDFPEKTTYYAIDASGSAHFFKEEPRIMGNCFYTECVCATAARVGIPMGYDWRNMKWSKQKAAKIHKVKDL